MIVFLPSDLSMTVAGVHPCNAVPSTVVSCQGASHAASVIQDLPPALIFLQIRPCLHGEIVGQQGDVCDQCPDGQYSLDQADQACSPCPDSAMCPNGTTSFIPAEGFWHSAANATLMHRCPNSNACR
jgi:hypothetical protein